MALRWLEGFENPTTLGALHQRIYASASANNLFAETGVSGGNACSGDDQSFTTNALVAATEDSWIMGCAFRSDDGVEINDPDAPYLAIGNTDGEQVRLEFVMANPANSKPGGLYYKIRAMRGATELCSSNEVFEIDTSDQGWIFFEFKVTIDNVTGSVEGRYHYLNKPSRNPSGAYTALTWDAANTNIDTREQTSAGGDRFTLSFNTGNTSDPVAFDDIYVCDSTGSKNNDYLGKITIQRQTITLTGGGDGDTADWDVVSATNTEDALQEPQASAEDDKRITSNTTNDVHLAAMSALPAIISDAPIVGVRWDLHMRMETTGSLGIAHMARKTTGTPAQTAVGTDTALSSTTVVANTEIMEDDPNTATDWVNLDVDSYQYGVRNEG